MVMMERLFCLHDDAKILIVTLMTKEQANEILGGI
jgi:hypothetical protein